VLAALTSSRFSSAEKTIVRYFRKSQETKITPSTSSVSAYGEQMANMLRAGSSTELSEGHPEYDSTVGATARFQRNYNGKQPGDPKKAAQVIVQLTQERNPPLRLLLGSDAYAAAEKNDLARLEEARIWKKLSVSTDFETK
jgi:hypothetical protein